MNKLFFWVLWLAAPCSACSSSTSVHNHAQDAALADAGISDAPDDTDAAPVTECNVAIAAPADEGHDHTTECVFIAYSSNPPSSGMHYARYPAFGVYRDALPRGFWVHSLEHGGIVVTYNCPDGCADDVSRAEAWLKSLLPDPGCVAQSQTRPRVTLTPDPLLTTRWAASSWGHSLRATCFDPQAFSDFYAAHAGHGLEDICFDGFDPRLPDGSLSVPATCGR